MVVSLERPPVTDVAIGLATMAVVAVASWRFPPAGAGIVALAGAVCWTAAVEFPRLAWPALPAPGALEVVARTGALLVVAATVTAFRQALRRLVHTEDALTMSLRREHDSARRDALTRLWNARHLHEALEREIARCRRYGRPFGLLVLDLDGFKSVNDAGGHEAGDAVLQAVGSILRESCRASDVPARLGGDEFAIILPETSSLTVPRYALRLVERIAAAPIPPGLPRVTASIGGVAFERAPASVREALAAADEAMYVAKREGKNRIAMRRAVPVA